MTQPIYHLFKLFVGLLFLLTSVAVEAKVNIKVQEITTDKGIKAWFVQDKTTPVITLKFIFLDAGSASDPKGKEGRAELMATMLGEGAGDLDRKALAAAFEDRAIKLNLSIGWDGFNGVLQTLKEHKQKALELTKLVLTKPRFVEADFARVKQQVYTHLANIEQDPREMAAKKMRHVLFQEHAYARQPTGTKESVQALTVADMRAYLATHLGRDRLIVALVGDMPAKDAKKIIDHVLGHFPAKSKTPHIADIDLPAEKSTHVISADVPQSFISFAHNGIKIGHPDMLKAVTLMYVLGTGSVSRLNEEIREKRGLVYYVGSAVQPRLHTGLVLGQLGTKNASAKEAIELVRTEFERMQRHGLTQKELQDAKTYLMGSYPLQFRDSIGLASVLTGYQLAGYDKNYINVRSEKIKKLTLEEMNAFVKTLLKPDELTFVVVGKPDGMVPTDE